MKTLALLFLAFSAAVPARAQGGPARVYLALDDHTDYLWTADEETYRQAFLAMTDYYLDLADATATNPDPFQSRFNLDGSFWAWVYERNRTPAQFDRLMSRIADGHLSMPLNTLVGVYGGAPAEAVLRGMYYAGRLERRYGLRFPMAVAMENQTLPAGLASLWAGSGARWSWRGVCGCATQVPDLGDRDHEVYWYTGLDGQRVLMKWNSLLGVGVGFDNEGIGGYAEARYPRETVGFVTYDPDFLARWPYAAVGAFGKGWDDLQTLTDEFITVAQDSTVAGRAVIVSNEQDFFADFEADYGAGLPAKTRSYGNEWDVLIASMTEVSAEVRRAVEKLRAAEALAAVVAQAQPGFLAAHRAARDSAFTNLGLYYEHDWTADGPVPRAERAAWQRRTAAQVTRYVDRLLTDASARLGGAIPRAGGTTRFYAFNPLGWTRTDAVDLPLSPSGPTHVVDVTTGAEVPSQPVTVDGQAALRILARDVPAVGYRVYEVRAGTGDSLWTPAATVAGSTLENAALRATLAGNGAVSSLVDRARGNREWAGLVDGRRLNDLGAGAGSVAVVENGPVTVTLRATASGPLAHTTDLTFRRDADFALLRNTITQNFGGLETWAFAFNLTAPDVHHEEVGAVLRARLTTAGGHYSPRNARYDWLSFGHFADVAGGAGGVTISNGDAHFFKLGRSTASTLDTATPLVQALAGGQALGGGLGILNQDGDSRFLHRFALRPHGGYDATAAMRFALEHQNGLVAGRVRGRTGAPAPAGRFSFLSISDPSVLLWALKPAEDGGRDVVARVWNQSGVPRPFTLQPAFAVASAARTTHLETTLGPATVAGGALTETVGPFAMATYRLRLNLDQPTLMTETEKVPTAPTLSPPHPNPAPDAATLAYTLPAPATVRLEVFDVLGRHVALLADGPRPAGTHAATLDTRGLAAGPYLVRLTVGAAVVTARLTVVR